MPKNFQISQYDLPICVNGHLDVEVDGVSTRVGITRVHQEEDTGKTTQGSVSGRIHEADSALVDYNRAGVPLVEVVSEPDIRSPEEAGAYLRMGTQNNISGNSIYDNAGLGIDLGTEGIDENDFGDTDTGRNQLQNYPVLSSATTGYGSSIAQGSLNSTPGTSYRLEFFANSAWDPFWIPEGQFYNSYD